MSSLCNGTNSTNAYKLPIEISLLSQQNLQKHFRLTKPVTVNYVTKRILQTAKTCVD